MRVGEKKRRKKKKGRREEKNLQKYQNNDIPFIERLFLKVDPHLINLKKKLAVINRFFNYFFYYFCFVGDFEFLFFFF